MNKEQLDEQEERHHLNSLPKTINSSLQPSFRLPSDIWLETDKERIERTNALGEFFVELNKQIDINMKKVGLR